MDIPFGKAGKMSEMQDNEMERRASEIVMHQMRKCSVEEIEQQKRIVSCV